MQNVEFHLFFAYYTIIIIFEMKRNDSDIFALNADFNVKEFTDFYFFGHH